MTLDSKRSEAAQIVLMGDSWAGSIDGPLTAVAQAEGFTVDFAAGTSNHFHDAKLMAGDLQRVTQILDENPDANVVHLSIGGNDRIAQALGSPGYSLPGIVQDVNAVANHINTIRPDVQIFHVGYDYFPPAILTEPGVPPWFTIPMVNQIFQDMAVAIDNGVTASNYTTLNYYGLMQQTYGIPELGIPVGHPSLPNASLQSPAIAFADSIHYTNAGYQVLAQRAFDDYKSSLVLVPEPGSAWLLVFISFGMVAGHRRRWNNAFSAAFSGTQCRSASFVACLLISLFYLIEGQVR